MSMLNTPARISRASKAANRRRSRCNIKPGSHLSINRNRETKRNGTIVARQRVVALLLLRRRRARRRRWVWVHPINERRQEQGVYHNLVQELRADPERLRQSFNSPLGSVQWQNHMV
ncbi:unnamed protein product [Arctogadus glacialis]